MIAKQIEGYIKYTLQKTPRHDCHALAKAITYMGNELDHDECELLYLLLENKLATIERIARINASYR